MDALDYVRSLKSRRRLILACVVTALVIAWVTTPDEPTIEPAAEVGESFTASHRMLYTPPAEALAAGGLESSLPGIAFLTTTGIVPERAAALIGFEDEPALLASRITVEVDDLLDVMTISMTGPDGDRAAEVANAFAESLKAYLGELAEVRREAAAQSSAAELEVVRERLEQLTAQVAAGGAVDPLLETQRQVLLQEYAELFSRVESSTSSAGLGSGLLTLEEATPVPAASSSTSGFEPPTNRWARLLIALAVSLVLGAVLALFIDRLDPRLRSRRAVEESLGLPVVAEVPLRRRSRRKRATNTVEAVSEPTSATAEAHRRLRTALVTATARAASGASGNGNGVAHLADQPPRLVVVTSAERGEGKTTTVANLAAVHAEAGRSVLVVDADIRRPTIHRLLGVDDERGVTTLGPGGYLSGALAGVVQESTIPGVKVVAAGPHPPNLGELVARLRDIIEAARPLADVVLVDTPGLLVADDAAALIPAADAVIIVARYSVTRTAAAREMRQLLDRMDLPVIVATLVGVPQGSVPSYDRSSLVSRFRRLPLIGRVLAPADGVPRQQPPGTPPASDRTDDAASTTRR